MEVYLKAKSKLCWNEHISKFFFELQMYKLLLNEIKWLQ